ncbi:MAG: acyl-CoA dehydrogenase family protein [Alcanivorax sp.]|jgi:alkylation response protein AidB-like acyl-CoA dehydrogenase|uniref:Acyl-CoA dehydrogenase n=1 Tax=Alloalcanivorax venustensis ISO4 TaxID=1177184 RepID=A0ABS0AEP6_9GAMM|nr:acyl-CoA dehydrogenase family protein [Alloalcanivorax venustensis]KXJ47692.1 MAG: acyl-CoA dehydrogenase [Alcanivorax sp. Nap_24]MAK23221.1 acyl-CoA dehydrogenase [Alcanivorax sp.]MCH9783324.1 acyl-CoA dehydrogenase family protein [Gammaproteobacteria bacterium]MBD3650104.1 acyl-CoA dehydrogenase family protein [Alcanivorax sp.]MBF47843.1 acyl-CoA dehydrogenase [Alcanivorax sp.]|tara:strand:- start:59149 stop:60300 length:1152 start_codon:yes stop_codon:yes gene_type:complete
MDFNFTDEQLAFRDTARQFADKELAPFAAEWDQHGTFPKDTIRRAGELGFCALYCDEDQGGMGLSRLDAALIFEQMAAGCTSTTAFITIHNMATWMLSRFGSEAVRQRWNGPLMSGEALASYCLTEPGAGSDAASLKTSARRDGDEYVLNGAKAFISGAGDTDLLVLMARTGGPGAGGISCFAIPSDTPGVSYGRNEDKMGWKSQPTRAVILEDARVPVENRIGDEGQGFKIAMAGLDGGRINIASCSLGAASAALAQAQSYVQERRQFDQPVSEFQSVQFTLADMATHLVAAQQMVRLAAWKLDNGDADKGTFCAMAKRLATDLCFDVCNQALQLHGGYGYIKEYPLERYVRDSRVHQILEGTNEIMRVIIARRVLKDLSFL